VASLLIVLGCVLAPLAGVAVWARNQVTNTDRYVTTVAPLARDPAIQNAIADQITLTDNCDYQDLGGDYFPGATPIASVNGPSPSSKPSATASSLEPVTA
jgi:hypothetical protein